MFTIEKLQKKLSALTDKKKFLVAFSGGMDSHVLLHGLVCMRSNFPGIEIRAIHVHHGLSENADQWAEHCKKLCAELGLEFIVKYIDVKEKLTDNHSQEAIARELRYQEFAKILAKDECLVAAHHADDQAETLLLQLFRGSGTKGLSAMPDRRGFLHGALLRPLLEFSRNDLHQYAIQNQLKWIEDESNENIGYNRNYVRHKLMPNVKQRWPGILKTLARTAEHCAQASELLDILAEQDYLQMQGSAKYTLSVTKLQQSNSARQSNVIRYWFSKLNLPAPTSIKLQHILKDVLNCQPSAMPVVHWRGAEIRRYRDDLYAMPPLKEHDTTIILLWKNLEKSLVLPNDLGILHWQDLSLPQANNITVRFRQGGEKLTIKGQQGAHSLKKLFQEWGIPPWQRDRIPLIYKNDELIAVVATGLLSREVFPHCAKNYKINPK